LAAHARVKGLNTTALIAGKTHSMLTSNAGGQSRASGNICPDELPWGKKSTMAQSRNCVKEKKVSVRYGLGEKRLLAGQGKNADIDFLPGQMGDRR